MSPKSILMKLYVWMPWDYSISVSRTYASFKRTICQTTYISRASATMGLWRYFAASRSITAVPASSATSCIIYCCTSSITESTFYTIRATSSLCSSCITFGVDGFCFRILIINIMVIKSWASKSNKASTRSILWIVICCPASISSTTTGNTYNWRFVVY